MQYCIKCTSLLNVNLIIDSDVSGNTIWKTNFINGIFSSSRYKGLCPSFTTEHCISCDLQVRLARSLFLTININLVLISIVDPESYNPRTGVVLLITRIIFYPLLLVFSINLHLLQEFRSVKQNEKYYFVT